MKHRSNPPNKTNTRNVSGNLMKTTMKYAFLLMATILFASCSCISKRNQSNDTIISDTISSPMKSQSDLVSNYISVRDKYIEHLQGIQKTTKNFDSLYKLDDNALLDLENKLKTILRESQYSVKGKIGLETLLGYMGFGGLDGLVFEQDSLRIYYTSNNLFFHYFKKNNITQLDNLNAADLENIFNSAFVIDAHISNLFSSKIPSTKDIQVYRMVGLVSQMTGPFPPDHLYVLVSKGNYIYMAEKHLKQPINEIHACKFMYDSIYYGFQTRQDITNSSSKQDTIMNKKHEDLFEKAWSMYCDCYQKEFKNSDQYKEIQMQIERMVDFLEQENNK